MKIIKDKDGNLINIGDWDYKIDESLLEDERIKNPLPEGATEHDAEVVTGFDGGLYLADDPKRLG
jgi:sulfur relay (sulfurtransferase) DsrC/TusE family protein